jgi:ATP citrate (pro-S)-lyase
MGQVPEEIKTKLPTPSQSPPKPRVDSPELVASPIGDRFTHFPSAPTSPHPWYQPFTASTRAFVYGMQPRAVQGMLDFDHMCKRATPSVAAMVYPFGGSHVQKFYWGQKETLLPVSTSLAEAVKTFPEVDTVINFASFRSVCSLCAHDEF